MHACVPLLLCVVSCIHTFALCHSSVEYFIELQVSFNWLSFVVCAQLSLYCTEHVSRLSNLHVAIVT